MDEKRSLLPRTSADGKKARYVLVIHGGAGTMSKEGSTPDQRAKYRAALSTALEAGYAVLKDGGEAMDAAVAAVSSMEGMCPGLYGRLRLAYCTHSSDCPLFNSGKGAVFNAEGKVRMTRPDHL